MEITETEYRAGKSDILDLLDSQKRYLEYNIDYYKQLAESEIILSELEKIVGVIYSKGDNAKDKIFSFDRSIPDGWDLS